MDFNEIISVDLKELQPEYRKEGYKYILYIDEVYQAMKGVLTKDKEADTVILAAQKLDNWCKRHGTWSALTSYLQ